MQVATNPLQHALVERIRALLVGEPSLREVAMFGGRSFMVNDKMVVSALGNGDLLVRVPAALHDELLEMDGAYQAEMGAGRTMGAGWITVTAESITSAEQLAVWTGVALEHNQHARKAKR
ncbi:MAG: TfoX/Sxy family protein [Phycisphaerales bacterium]